jgi:hypothetical protein
MAQPFCPACRKLLAGSGAVIFFGNALVHAACWSELRKPPGKAAMDFAYGRALRGTSRQLQEMATALAESAQASAAGQRGSPASP